MTWWLWFVIAALWIGGAGLAWMFCRAADLADRAQYWRDDEWCDRNGCCQKLDGCEIE